MKVNNAKRRLKRANDSMEALKEKIKVLKRDLRDSEDAEIIRSVRKAMTFEDFKQKWAAVMENEASDSSTDGAGNENISERTEVDEKKIS